MLHHVMFYQVPAVKLLSSDMDYGEVFVRYPYVREIVLVNPHPELSAKYEILAQEETALDIAALEGLPPIGAIPPNSQHPIKIQLTSDKLGSFRIPLHVAIRGSIEPPLQVNGGNRDYLFTRSIGANISQLTLFLRWQVNVNAVSRGPRVELSHAEIKWGPTDCLKV